MSGILLASMRALTTELVLVRAREIHGDKYNYDKFVYTNKRVKATITCPDHGDFEQLPLNHVKGDGCRRCRYVTTALERTYSNEVFIEKGREAHGDLYDYSKTNYVGSRQHVTIICRRHGEFSQNAHSHIRGFGCPKCGWELLGLNGRLTQQQHIAACVAKHGDVYDYSKTVYTLSNENVVITCKTHGEFVQMADTHKNGLGCPRCTTQPFSRAAISWLTYRAEQDGVHIEHALNGGERKVYGRFKADGFSAETNTVYEYYGDFWHGNPALYDSDYVNPISKKRMGDLYDKTLQRRHEILALGYNLVEIWDSEWNLLRSVDFFGP